MIKDCNLAVNNNKNNVLIDPKLTNSNLILDLKSSSPDFHNFITLISLLGGNINNILCNNKT